MSENLRPQDEAHLRDEHDNAALSLPTEAQWEYACRAGTTTPWFAPTRAESMKYAHTGHFIGGTVDAGTKEANAFGLYDMHGNVWEWVADCVSDGSSAPAADCAARTVKGGSWNAPAETLAAEARSTKAPTARDSSTGFRVARDIP